MAEFKATIKREKAREMVSNSGTELTDELFAELGYAHQLIVNIHEKFVGPVKMVGEYEGRYYTLRETQEAVAKVLELQ